MIVLRIYILPKLIIILLLILVSLVKLSYNRYNILYCRITQFYHTYNDQYIFQMFAKTHKIIQHLPLSLLFIFVSIIVSLTMTLTDSFIYVLAQNLVFYYYFINVNLIQDNIANVFKICANNQIYNSQMADNEDFFIRYYIGHKGAYGHQYLDFEIDSNGKLKYLNNSQYKSDSLISKQSTYLIIQHMFHLLLLTK